MAKTDEDQARSRATGRGGPSIPGPVWPFIVVLVLLWFCTLLRVAADRESPGLFLAGVTTLLGVWVGFGLWMANRNNASGSWKPHVVRCVSVVGAVVFAVAVYRLADGEPADQATAIGFAVTIIAAVVLDSLPRG